MEMCISVLELVPSDRTYRGVVFWKMEIIAPYYLLEINEMS